MTVLKWCLYITADFKNCGIDVAELIRLLSAAYPGNCSILHLDESRQDLGIVVSIGRGEFAGADSVLELIDLLRAKFAKG